MNEHEHMAVITCRECQQRAEFELIHVIDSEENVYEKQLLLNGNLFEHKCANCGTVADILFECTYVDRENNMMVYLVHEGHFDGAHMMLHMMNAIEQKYLDQANTSASQCRKRIVTCHHKLREKVLVLDTGLDDRIIEIIKIICISNVDENIPDLHPISAEFVIKDGKPAITVFGENDIVTALIPEGLYEHIEEEFEEVLEEDDPYVVDEIWAMDVMGIDPYDECDCDGDCENCSHDGCDDDYDEACDGCECDCNGCDCLKREDRHNEGDSDE